MIENRPVSNKPIRLRLNKRLYIIVVCFFISSLFWVLIAMSHLYPTNITFPVIYKNLPGQKVITNDLPQKVTVQLRTTGFKVLSYEFQKEQSPIEIDVGAKLGNAIRSDVLSIATRSFMMDFSKELGAEVAITGFQPDSIIFNFSDRISKRLPVKLRMNISMEKQYDTVGAPLIVPANVTVSGPPSVIDPMTEVLTKSVTLSDVKSTIRENIDLELAKLISSDAERVSITIPVEKFTEGTAEVKVRPTRVPDGFILKTFPDKVKIRYQVSVSDYNKVNPAAFDVIVDGSELEEKRPVKIPVELIEHPVYIREPSVEPERVDYILRKL